MTAEDDVRMYADMVSSLEDDLKKAKDLLRGAIARAWSEGVRGVEGTGKHIVEKKPSRYIDESAWIRASPDTHDAWAMWMADRYAPEPTLKSVEGWLDKHVAPADLDGIKEAIVMTETADPTYTLVKDTKEASP